MREMSVVANKEREKYPEKWIGMPASRFLKYRSWINKGKPGICGTYCSAVLIHDAIYQETRKSLNRDVLLKGLKVVVDNLMPYRGTYFWDVAFGIRRILADMPEWKVRMGLIPEKIVPEVLSKKGAGPIVVGTNILLNSQYKNHWLVVYAYGYNEEGKLYFRAYDNHGRYKAIIPASQTISCVWLEKNS
ncbi:dihydrolipoamide dehydrogenase [Jeotgalibaca ciconiae]|nr:dihydrolipoamide dehydrogenase [Jeotgalibaca ciconiae]